MRKGAATGSQRGRPGLDRINLITIAGGLSGQPSGARRRSTV
jgi:hypothetical protein